jgi:hypothetical protein
MLPRIGSNRRVSAQMTEAFSQPKCLGGSRLVGDSLMEATFALKRSHRIVSLLFAIKIRRHRFQFLCFCRTYTHTLFTQLTLTPHWHRFKYII